MKIITQPTVYLLGKQTVVPDELARFLGDHGVDWSSDSEVPAEILTETAGRLCFDDRTELLTRSGWKPVSDVLITDEVATLNPQSRNLEYQGLLAHHEYDYDGDLVVTEGRDISFAVTPEHRQFASVVTKDGWAEFDFMPTSTTATYRLFRVLTSPNGWVGEVPEFVHLEGVDWTQDVANQFGNMHGTVSGTTQAIAVTGKDVLALAQLVAHYIANGSLRSQPGAGHGLVIYGREHETIVALAKQLGFGSQVYEDKRNRCKRTHINGGKTLASWFENECGRRYYAKRFPTWVMSLPSESLRDIWAIMVRTDGHRYENGREIVSTGSSVVAGQLQELLCKIGCSSSLSCVTTNGVPCWTVSRKIGRPALRSRFDLVNKHYKGKVYCPTTLNGIVYVRRNGKVHFSGNCYMSFAKPRPGGNNAYLNHIKEVGHGSVTEHAVWNLLFTGVSRSLTHELIRHRAGMGYSQLSQRYVDESVAEYILPDIIAQDPELLQIWSEVIETCHQGYKTLVEKLTKKLYDKESSRMDLTSTERRKTARQAARSVLPNATETKIFVTANARALRHFLEQRGAAAAEPEIRKLANQVLDVLQKDSPNLFGDYTKVLLPDGTYEITTQYKKV